jgi:tRNA A-37 threonylcarbamoyl transferase component Bud32
MSLESSVQDVRRTHRVGKYEVLAHIATGGMAAVYKARDHDLNRVVALKVLSHELAAQPIRLERFRREARHAAKLRHENIVSIYEFGEADGLYFLALEFVEGQDLFDHISQQGQLDPEEARQILIQAVQALSHANAEGIIHRDIKPSNFLLTHKEGQLQVKLTDFGLSRQQDDAEFRVTGDGLTVGTIDYMAPEQARDSRLADVRSDIYSLGCTWFHMLAGRAPFAEGTLTERIYKHGEAEAPEIRTFNRKVNARTAAMLRRMLAKKPEQRYQTPAELLDDLISLDLERTSGASAIVPEATSERLAASSLAGRRQGPPPSPTELVAAEERAASLLGVSADQRRAASGQYERGKEVLATGNYEYGIQLLLSACKLDPVNVRYRRALRRIGKAREKQSPYSRWLMWLTTLTDKTRLKAVKRAGDPRRVLEYGEQILVRNPSDFGTQMDMAEAATTLGLHDLAVWLLEHARSANPRHLALNRTLARLYEKQGKLSQAITVWEMMRKLDPTDLEAARKVKNLAAAETIARGNYEG